MPKIEREQWQRAQDWERTFWDNYVGGQKTVRHLAIVKTVIKKFVRDGPGDDSNYWWERQFDGYHFIPQSLGNVIEFGCGPFTNLRRILNGRVARHVVASDPLAKHYVMYKGYQLARKWRRREWLIDDHPLEETPFADNYFDLVICVNVLDHVQDVECCLRNLVRVTRVGGILLFGQDLTSCEDVRATRDVRERTGTDIGHPHIFPSEECFDQSFVHFDVILRKVLSREEGRSPVYHCGTFLFAGKRKA